MKLCKGTEDGNDKSEGVRCRRAAWGKRGRKSLFTKLDIKKERKNQKKQNVIVYK